MIDMMQELQQLVKNGVRDFKQYGEVQTKEFDNLILFDYTNTCQFLGRWNWFERVSRGLILDKHSGAIVARPFDKFFNYGEKLPTSDMPIQEATEKMDGSLGILYRHNGFKIATRGSFVSEQALWATDYLNKHHNLSTLPAYITLLFEIIYPENRVVIDYKGFKGLVLIGARQLISGYDLPYTDLKPLADKYGFTLPKVYYFADVQSILEAATKLSANEEGWVVRYADGHRYKIKGDAYKIAHKLMTGITFNRVLEAYQTGDLESMISGVPDEFLGQIKAYQVEINETVNDIEKQVLLAHFKAPKQDRKTYALYVKETCPHLMPYMFARLDGKDILPIIYRNAFKDRK